MLYLECQHFSSFVGTLSELIGMLMFLLIQAELSAATGLHAPDTRVDKFDCAGKSLSTFT